MSSYPHNLRNDTILKWYNELSICIFKCFDTLLFFLGGSMAQFDPYLVNGNQS